LFDSDAVCGDEAGGIGAGLEGELEHPEHVCAQDLADWQLGAGVDVKVAASGADHELRDTAGSCSATSTSRNGWPFRGGRSSGPCAASGPGV
jgi:hypothetical protein